MDDDFTGNFTNCLTILCPYLFYLSLNKGGYMLNVFEVGAIRFEHLLYFTSY